MYCKQFLHGLMLQLLAEFEALAAAEAVSMVPV
jgi:hypothetical protein